MNNQKMKIAGDTTICEGAFLRLIGRRFLDRDGQEAVWEMVERKVGPRIVGIAAVTPEGEIILEKNFRMPFGEYVIEFPAGLMDKEGESGEEAARRELREETGYGVDTMELLASGPFHSGLAADELMIYYGTNAVRSQEPAPDSAEDIEVIKVPFKDLLDFLLTQKDVKIDIKIAAVIPFLERKMRL